MSKGLSTELVSEFVKVVSNNNKKDTTKDWTGYGTIVEMDGVKYVKMDGSDLLTPAASTTDTVPGERVTVSVKNHQLLVTGNISSPAARTDALKEAALGVGQMGDNITRLEIAIADKVSTEDFDAEKARIDVLVADNVTIRQNLTANKADIDELTAETVKIEGRVTANEAKFEKLVSDKIDISVADIRYAKVIDLEATDAKVNNLQSTYATFASTTTNKLTAVDAEINSLGSKYANIDFSNIGQAAMEYFYAQSGLIENVTIDNGTITGNLIGVTIKGDVIEGNTVVADKLVILGEDGLYYKLNTDGVTITEEQTEYNSLNGQVILAKSVTAEKVNVDDLVAFDATIGGFNITEKSIYSEVKDSEGNTTRGIYMDTDGQINFGDSDKFIKYYKDEEDNYHLVVSADTVLYSIDGKQKSIEELGIIGEYVKISTYEDEPCIELGETDSDFKLVITNTRILFMEGTGIPAYINNQSLFIKKAVIEEELQQGAFLWKSRSNGNLGLVWKGV